MPLPRTGVAGADGAGVGAGASVVGAGGGMGGVRGGTEFAEEEEATEMVRVEGDELTGFLIGMTSSMTLSSGMSSMTVPLICVGSSA